MIEYEAETQPLSPAAETAYELFMGMSVDEWLFFLQRVETGAVLDDDTTAAFNRAFAQRGRGEDRNG